jgi:hypothetical protein
MSSEPKNNKSAEWLRKKRIEAHSKAGAYLLHEFMTDRLRETGVLKAGEEFAEIERIEECLKVRIRCADGSFREEQLPDSMEPVDPEEEGLVTLDGKGGLMTRGELREMRRKADAEAGRYLLLDAIHTEQFYAGELPPEEDPEKKNTI